MQYKRKDVKKRNKEIFQCYLDMQQEVEKLHKKLSLEYYVSKLEVKYSLAHGTIRNILQRQTKRVRKNR